MKNSFIKRDAGEFFSGLLFGTFILGFSNEATTYENVQHNIGFCFQALPGEVVWLRFSKFRSSHHKSDIYRTVFCSNTLSLMDGPPFLNANVSIIGQYCHCVSTVLFCQTPVHYHLPANKWQIRNGKEE